ncbi:hypothetical protein CDEST_05639 [Colletotrichum destructivum]|uniref:Uncharacterized protein n=1 Tax=Colletotrichum destructivum TaxID=34406 RepID=A0AAX4IC61_9PEZI|nr:hypothetical protein CDEST_05639 [Colletotrichum destructivum]
MDLLDELESMARFAATQPEDTEPNSDDVKRWQSLLGYTYFEAAQKIKEHRSNFARRQVSEHHWEMVRADKEAQGHDKESYAYSCTLSPIKSPVAAALQTKNKARPATYLLKLEGPFSDPEIVKRAGGAFALPPSRLIGIDDTGAAVSFCKVDEATKKSLLAQLSRIGSVFQPTFVRYSQADKDLSAASVHPTLGSGATLPHNRLSSESDQRLLPAQDHYPVCCLGVEPVYRPTKTRGGVLATWGGKYRALVDAPASGTASGTASVEGHAFLVADKDQEDALRYYETDNYEVVRCVIDMGEGEEVRGLTFRFIGEADA